MQSSADQGDNAEQLQQIRTKNSELVSERSSFLSCALL